MDDVQYLRQDWNNRNRIKTAQGPIWLTVPVDLKGSDSLILRDVRIDRSKAGGKHDWRVQHWKAIKLAYARAPYWETYAGAFEDLYVGQSWEWLAELARAQLVLLLGLLDLSPQVIVAGDVGFQGRKSDLVLDHCRRFNAAACVLGTHGRDYIVREDFIAAGASVYFQDYRHPAYPQRFGDFAPYMSIIDLLFNCGPESRNILLSGNVQRPALDAALAAGPPQVLDLTPDARS